MTKRNSSAARKSKPRVRKPKKPKNNMKTLMADFQRMDLMLKSFQRIGVYERRWFIERLLADHNELIRREQEEKKR
jgi:hypothetical protein